MLSLKTFVEGPVDANNYLLIDEDSNEAVLIDCSSNRPEFIQAVKSTGVKLKYILLTHGHFDHILGVNDFQREFGVKAYLSKDDEIQVKYAPQMYGMFTGENLKNEININNFLNEKDEFKIGNTIIKPLSTPGHTKGGMCYLVDGKLFSGDTLFRGSVGRCDLPEGDFNSILKSIKEKLFTLPDHTEVFTGHGPETTIGYEKKYNELANM